MADVDVPEGIGVDGAITNFIDDLRDHARQFNGFTLEIGCGVGTGSTVAFQLGLVDWARLKLPDHSGKPLHISIDISDRLIWKPVVPWWYMVIGDSREQSTFDTVIAIAAGRYPGTIFIDTEHTYEHMAAELARWSPIAGDGTTWLFHDTYIWGNYNPMTDAIKDFAAANGWVYDDFRTEAHGLGRMRR